MASLPSLLGVWRDHGLFAVALLLLACVLAPAAAALYVSATRGAVSRPWDPTAWYYASALLLVVAAVFLPGAIVLCAVPLLALLGPMVGWAIYRHRDLGPGKCEECGYDLTGNTSGACPECGAAVRQGPRRMR